MRLPIVVISIVDGLCQQVPEYIFQWIETLENMRNMTRVYSHVYCSLVRNDVIEEEEKKRYSYSFFFSTTRLIRLRFFEKDVMIRYTFLDVNISVIYLNFRSFCSRENFSLLVFGE